LARPSQWPIDNLLLLWRAALASFLNSNVQDDGFTLGTTLSNWWPKRGGAAQRKLANPKQNHSPDVPFINGIRPIGSSFRED